MKLLRRAGDRGTSVRERIDLTDRLSPWSSEHLARYAFAARYVPGRVVLDCACGSGAGAVLLAEAGAVSVIAGDSDMSAAAGLPNPLPPNLELVTADVCGLDIEDNAVDVAVSFETIEHVEMPEVMVSELARVLVDDGTLLLSTPNARLRELDPDIPSNRYHVREFAADELEQLLLQHFRTVTVCGHLVAEEYRPCPFWEEPARPPASVAERLQSALWKLLVRLPRVQGEWLSGVILRRPLFPPQNGFEFVPGRGAEAHDLLAICEGPR